MEYCSTIILLCLIWSKLGLYDFRLYTTVFVIGHYTDFRVFDSWNAPRHIFLLPYAGIQNARIPNCNYSIRHIPPVNVIHVYNISVLYTFSISVIPPHTSINPLTCRFTFCVWLFNVCAQGEGGTCSNCGVFCSITHRSPKGHLCNSCYQHWR